jgi:ribosomal protein L4
VGSKNLYRACRNIPRVKGLAANSLNVVDLLSYKNVLIDKNAINEIK